MGDVQGMSDLTSCIIGNRETDLDMIAVQNGLCSPVRSLVEIEIMVPT